MEIDDEAGTKPVPGPPNPHKPGPAPPHATDMRAGASPSKTRPDRSGACIPAIRKILGPEA